MKPTVLPEEFYRHGGTTIRMSQKAIGILLGVIGTVATFAAGGTLANAIQARDNQFRIERVIKVAEDISQDALNENAANAANEKRLDDLEAAIKRISQGKK